MTWLATLFQTAPLASVVQILHLYKHILLLVQHPHVVKHNVVHFGVMYKMIQMIKHKYDTSTDLSYTFVQSQIGLMGSVWN